MPKATFTKRTPEGLEHREAPFQTPRKVGDLSAWERAAFKALGLSFKKTAETFTMSEHSIILIYGEAVLSIDRNYYYRFTGSPTK